PVEGTDVHPSVGYLTLSYTRLGQGHPDGFNPATVAGASPAPPRPCVRWLPGGSVGLSRGWPTRDSRHSHDRCVGTCPRRGTVLVAPGSLVRDRRGSGRERPGRVAAPSSWTSRIRR